MTKSLRFNCVSCGKCCKGSTMFTIDESIHYASKVSIEGSIQSPGTTMREFKSHGRIAKEHALRTNIKCSIDSRIHLVYAGLASVNPAAAQCPLLTNDDLCSVHGKYQPLRCQNLPISSHTFSVDKMLDVQTLLCPDDAMDGREIVKNDKVVDETRRQTGLKENFYVKQDKPIFEVALGMSLIEGSYLIDVVTRKVHPKDWIWNLPSALVIAVAAQAGRIDQLQAIEFCQNQSRFLHEFSNSPQFLDSQKDTLRRYKSLHCDLSSEMIKNDGPILEEINQFIDMNAPKLRRFKWKRDERFS